jgi:hypothetical protein
MAPFCFFGTLAAHGLVLPVQGQGALPEPGFPCMIAGSTHQEGSYADHGRTESVAQATARSVRNQGQIPSRT